MFRRIVGNAFINDSGFGTADSNPNKERIERAKQLFCLHPVELRALLELGWQQRMNDLDDNLGSPVRRSELTQLPDYFLKALFSNGHEKSKFFESNSARFNDLVQWDHLIYAYLIENTRIYDIFRRVLHHYLLDEKFGVPTSESQAWLRNTEELFFSDPAPFSIYNVRSHIRPDITATRRNAYYRMFGMDLNHGKENNQPYEFYKAEASNRDFVSTLEDFLQEVWVGISNNSNTSGANRTDNAAIANFARQLHDMLNDRRLNGNLSREEFFFVSMMSWFHLTVEFDSPILKSLRAEGSREDQRLLRVAQRVELPSHAKAYDFFQLAEPMSRLLTMIELGTFNFESNVPALFEDNDIETDLRTIITHWSIATGRDMKVRRGLNVSIPANHYRGYTTAQMPQVVANGKH